jgi:hypothetical protein
MASYSEFFSHKLLNWLRGTALGTLPSSFLALINNGTEVTTQVRAAGRVAVTFGAPANDAAGRAIAISGEVEFGESANDQDVTAIAVRDAATAGNLLMSGNLVAPKQAQVGKVFKIKDVKFNTSGDLEGAVKDAGLNWVRGNAAATPPAATFLALFNGATEVTTQVRAAGRLAVTFDAPAAKEMESNVQVAFGQSANAVDVTDAALFSAASGGTFLCKATLVGAPISVDAGDEVTFEPGDVVIQVL